jgi:hypothetical protein
MLRFVASSYLNFSVPIRATISLPFRFAPRVRKLSIPMGISERRDSRTDGTLATMTDDLPRQDATSNDRDYSLSIEEALARYDHAGHPRTTRSVQRYCARGHLDCLRQETPFGEKYMITPTSVARHIAQIEELARTTGRDKSRQDVTHFHEPLPRDQQREDVTTITDQPRHVATDVSPDLRQVERRQEGATSSDVPRQDATAPSILEKYVARLEGEVEFLREENATKNVQIKELTERSRETNLLIGGLQRTLAPLLGSPDPYPLKSDSESV